MDDSHYIGHYVYLRGSNGVRVGKIVAIPNTTTATIEWCSKPRSYWLRFKWWVCDRLGIETTLWSSER